MKKGGIILREDIFIIFGRDYTSVCRVGIFAEIALLIMRFKIAKVYKSSFQAMFTLRYRWYREKQMRNI